MVSKYCNISKTPGRGSIHASSPFYYSGGGGGGGGATLLVRPRIKGTSMNYNKDLDNFVYF